MTVRMNRQYTITIRFVNDCATRFKIPRQSFFSSAQKGHFIDIRRLILTTGLLHLIKKKKKRKKISPIEENSKWNRIVVILHRILHILHTVGSKKEFNSIRLFYTFIEDAINKFYKSSSICSLQHFHHRANFTLK